MTEIYSRYKRESIENFDLELPYINLRLFNNLPFIKTFVIILFISVGVFPFLPPIYTTSNWHFPTSFEDYWGQMVNVLYLFAIIIALVIIQDIVSDIRTFIDRRFGYKKVGVFKVTNVWNLLTRKIVFLNNAHFLTLRQKDYGFDETEIGQVLEIERTATHKFLDYQITK